MYAHVSLKGNPKLRNPTSLLSTMRIRSASCALGKSWKSWHHHHHHHNHHRWQPSWRNGARTVKLNTDLSLYSSTFQPISARPCSTPQDGTEMYIWDERFDFTAVMITVNDHANCATFMHNFRGWCVSAGEPLWIWQTDSFCSTSPFESRDKIEKSTTAARQCLRLHNVLVPPWWDIKPTGIPDLKAAGHSIITQLSKANWDANSQWSFVDSCGSYNFLNVLAALSESDIESYKIVSYVILSS